MLALQFVATLAATLFTGAAIYVNLAEHPARTECGTQLAATVFGPSYRRAAVMQIILALAATIAGICAWLLGAQRLWFVGAVLIFAVISVYADRDQADEQTTSRSWTRSRLGIGASALAGLGKTARGSERSCARGFGRFSVIGDLALNLATAGKIQRA